MKQRSSHQADQWFEFGVLKRGGFHLSAGSIQRRRRLCRRDPIAPQPGVVQGAAALVLSQHQTIGRYNRAFARQEWRA
jgi:hypothetical protein